MTPRDAVAFAVNRARWNLAALKFHAGVLRLRLTVLGYDPDQPRIPAGQTGGGRWTDGDGSGDVDGDARLILVGDEVPRYTVSLEEEENKPGAHTLREHIGRTDQEPLERLRNRRIRTLFGSFGERRAGTFSSRETANDLVNRTLEAKSSEVDLVASGRQGKAFITSRFGFKTGREARADDDTEPSMGDIYGVGVFIMRDVSSSRGYYAYAAYPRDE